jgi:hypothetical protein
MILVERDYLVHRFFRSISFPLRLLDLLRVSPFFDNEVEYVKHLEVGFGFSSVGIVAAMWYCIRSGESKRWLSFLPSALVAVGGVSAEWRAGILGHVRLVFY